VDASEEEKKDRERVARDGKAVEAMVAGAGWSKVIQPALKRWREASIRQFKESLTHDELVAFQKQIAAIDMVFALIESAKDEGEEALERLGKKP
jgi:hypothetical protein